MQMVKGTLFIVMLVLQNVLSFQFKQIPFSVGFPLRLNAEKLSLSRVAVRSSLPTKSAIGVIRHSFKHFLQSSLEKKIVIAAYPLTVILIYVLFTSTFVITSFKKFLQSVKTSTSIIKARLEVSPSLSASFVEAKEVVDEVVIQKNIEVDTEQDNVVHDNHLIEEIAMIKAKKDIEAKLVYIVQDEMKAKSVKTDVLAKLDLVNTENLDDSLIPGVALEVEVITAVATMKTAPVTLDVEETTMEIPSNAIKISGSKKEFRTEDFTVAFFVLLCVGSPFLQVMQQHMVSI
jgi:hypothetical protein